MTDHHSFEVPKPDDPEHVRMVDKLQLMRLFCDQALQTVTVLELLQNDLEARLEDPDYDITTESFLAEQLGESISALRALDRQRLVAQAEILGVMINAETAPGDK